jgi:hypothetical protein
VGGKGVIGERTRRHEVRREETGRASKMWKVREEAVRELEIKEE